MAKLMRMDVPADARTPRGAPDDFPESLARELAAARGREEQLGNLGAPGSGAPNLGSGVGFARAEIGREVIERDLAQRHQAPLLALAERGDDAARAIDVAERERDELAHAQARGVHQAEHGAIAEAAQRVRWRRLDQRDHLRFSERARQLAAEARTRGKLRRIRAQHALAHQEFAQAASGRQVPSGTAWSQAGA